MVLTLSRKEVEDLIREKFQLPDNVKVHISDKLSDLLPSTKYHDTDSIAPMKITVNNENFVEKIEDSAVHQFPEPVKSKKRLREMTMEEKSDTYERYAQVVEDFIHSDKDVQYIDLEGMSPSAMRYRYNTAIMMYGFKEECYASATEHGGDGYAKLVKRGAKCTTI